MEPLPCNPEPAQGVLCDSELAAVVGWGGVTDFWVVGAEPAEPQADDSCPEDPPLNATGGPGPGKHCVSCEAQRKVRL